MILLFFACATKDPPADTGTSDDTAVDTDTGETGETGETGDTGETGETGETGDSGGCGSDEYVDLDGDGWGAESSAGQDGACVPQGGDCDDTRPAVYPGATELACDGLDADCDGESDEVDIVIQSGATWLTSPVEVEGWTSPGFDDSAWDKAVEPAPEDCGWTFTEANLERPFEWWEKAGTLTMWAADGAALTHFRLAFNVPDPTAVTGAMITTIVDDAHSLYLNGEKVGGSDGVAIVETDLAAALVAGENVLAIEGVDYGGCRWAVVSAVVSCGG